jgi:hypothetical protein
MQTKHRRGFGASFSQLREPLENALKPLIAFDFPGEKWYYILGWCGIPAAPENHSRKQEFSLCF